LGEIIMLVRRVFLTPKPSQRHSDAAHRREYRRGATRHWTIRFSADTPLFTRWQHPAEREFAPLSTRERPGGPPVDAHS
jgi:hypothetical protein